MSHKTCFAACAIASLTVFTLFGYSGVDPYRSVEARPVVADTGELDGRRVRHYRDFGCP